MITGLVENSSRSRNVKLLLAFAEPVIILAGPFQVVQAAEQAHETVGALVEAWSSSVWGLSIFVKRCVFVRTITCWNSR